MRASISCAIGALAAAGSGCQNYDFRHLQPLLVVVNKKAVPIQAYPGIPRIMIVQDTSGSMCEPINHDAPLADGGSGAGDCAANLINDSKAGLVATNMVKVLGQLNIDAGSFFMGLAALPDQVDANAATCASAATPVIDIDQAGVSVPAIAQWYQGMPYQIRGGTPTAATLTAAAPFLLDAGEQLSRKYIILITDGLPNCYDKNPCVLDNANHLWSDGQGHGCESQTFEQAHLFLTSEPAGAIAPPECQCSAGSCPDPIGDGGTNQAATCCVSDVVALRERYSGSALTSQITTASNECLDTLNTTSVVTQLHDDGIYTFVIGMGFDYEGNGKLLDQLAVAGSGDPDAGHFQADDETSLYNAINGIISSIAVSCEYTLAQPPANAQLIEVGLDGVTLVQGDPNGFGYDPVGNQVILSGAACAKTKDGQAHNLTISDIGAQ